MGAPHNDLVVDRKYGNSILDFCNQELELKYLFLILVFFSLKSWAGAAYNQLTKRLPKDVVKVIDRRIGCNYWIGEMPDDANNSEVRESGRPQMIEKNLKELKCTRLENDEKALKAKYKNKIDILHALDEATNLSQGD